MRILHCLAFEMTPNLLAVIAGVGIVLLGVAWFGLRFWLASTRPVNIKDVQTPALDRMNRRALEGLADEPEDEDAPEGLKKVVEPEGKA